ncbi:MAG TPA: DUF11 domain-containing protein [Polyangiaceae bacterium]|jgi:uncharacterized repeat protein (TIGR01451 family)
MSLLKWLVICTAIAVTHATLAYAQTPTADLAVAESTAPMTNAGANFAVDVTVLNNGPDPADNVVLTDPIPNGSTFVSATQNSGTAFVCSTPAVGTSASPIRCTSANLASGVSASFTLVFHIDGATAPGTYFTDVSSVSTDTFDPTSEDDSGVAVTQTPPPPSADMRITKTGPTGANADTDVTYLIALTNGGPGGATLVSLEETIPGNMTFVSVLQTGGPTLTCGSVTGGVFTCTATTFAAGATASLTVVAHIPSGTGDGAIYMNSATVTSNYDPNSENDAATTLLCVQANGCLAGPCNSNRAVVCPAPDQCHDQGTCNTATGVCADNPPKANNTPCNDGTVCTLNDNCQAGVCQGSTLNCDDSNPCTTDTCDSVAGCVHVGVCEAGADGAPDGDATSEGGAIADGSASDSTETAAVDATDAVTNDVADAPLPDAPANSLSDATSSSDVVLNDAANRPADVGVDAAVDATTMMDVFVSVTPDVAAPDSAADASAVDARVATDASADSRTSDARADASSPDAAPEENTGGGDDSGCSCHVAHVDRANGAPAWFALLGLVAVRRAFSRQRKGARPGRVERVSAGSRATLTRTSRQNRQ